MLRSSEELLRRRLEGELRQGEEFVAGAAGRTKMRLLPQSMSLTGYYVALTTERLFVLYHDRLTSRPGSMKDLIELRDIGSREVESAMSGRSARIRLERRAATVFDLVFSGREREAATVISSRIATPRP